MRWCYRVHVTVLHERQRYALPHCLHCLLLGKPARVGSDMFYGCDVLHYLRHVLCACAGFVISEVTVIAALNARRWSLWQHHIPAAIEAQAVLQYATKTLLVFLRDTGTDRTLKSLVFLCTCVCLACARNAYEWAISHAALVSGSICLVSSPVEHRIR